jgi:hypothetical protein
LVDQEKKIYIYIPCKISPESLLRFARITVEGYFGKKISKVVNDGLTDRVLGLRDFETLRGSIVKIETSVTELKIVVNFKG